MTGTGSDDGRCAGRLARGRVGKLVPALGSGDRGGRRGLAVWSSTSADFFGPERPGLSPVAGRLRHGACWRAGVAEIQQLLVWQLANEVRGCIQQLTAQPVVRRDGRFVDQLHDSCSGIGRNIAEGYGRRRPREFAHFLFIARGSLAEVQDHLTEGVARGYWTERDITETRVYARRTRGAIDGLIRYLRTPEAERSAAAWERPRNRPPEE